MRSRNSLLGTSSNRLGLIAAAVAAVAGHLSSTARAQVAISWVGSTGSYVDGTNWSGGSAPTLAGDVDAAINNAGTAVINTGDAGEAAILALGLAPGDVGNLSIGGGTLNLGELNVGGRKFLLDNATPNAGGTGTFTQNGGAVTVSDVSSPSATPKQSLYIANGTLAPNTATGSYVMTAGTLVVGVTGSATAGTSAIIIGAGAGSVGSFVQSGGSVTLNGNNVGGSGIGTLQIANGGSSGTYSLSGTASLSVANGINIGAGAGSVGAFVQSGGSVTDTSDMNVAFATGTGSYSLSGGTLAVGGFINVGSGAGATGSFAQSAGTVTTVGALGVGQSGATGSYALTGGAVTVGGDMTVGGQGSSLSISGAAPTLTTKGSLYIAGSGTATGTLSAGSINIGTGLTQFLAVGNNAGSVGSFTQMPGTSITSTGYVQLGRNNSTGTYDMQGGTLTLGADSFIGGGNGQTTGTGTFSQAAGANVTTAGSISVGIGAAASTATGTYNLNGGTLTMNKAAGVLAIGNNGNGTVNQTGGTLTNTAAGAAVDVGRVPSSGTNSGVGIYNLSGTGVLKTTLLRTNANPGNQINLSGGSSTITTLTLLGGAVNVSGGNHTVTGAYTGGTATTTISGGTLSVGGTFNAGASNVTFSGSSAVNLAAVTVTTGSLTISGGTHTITGVISSGTNSLAVTGGTITWPTVANGLTLNSNVTFRTATSVDLSIPSPVLIGSPVNIQVDANALTLAGSITAATSARALNKTGTGTLVINNPTQTLFAGSSYNTKAGTLNLDATAANVIVNAQAGLTNFRNTETVLTLNITAGATAAIPANGSRTLTSTNLTAGGILDVADNAYDLAQTGATPLNTIRGLLASGYNAGTWTGTAGITSSVAAANPGHGLSYRDTGTAIEAKYAWLGDINFNGKIDADDYALLDRNFARGTFATGTAAQWSDGDFNYDGVVTSADYLAIDTALAHQSGHLSPDFLTAREAQFGPAYVAELTAAVPEPASLTILAVAGLAMGRRTRRSPR